MKTAPCKYCEDRYLACHDKCEKYKEWKAELDEKKAVREEALKKDRERPIWTKSMIKQRLCRHGKWLGSKYRRG